MGPVAGLCPITEASLGDGIFDAQRYLTAGGKFGIGSDSNIRISLNEELRSLEYSQRLRDHNRAILACPGQSSGNVLLTGAATGGAQAAGRNAGAIRVGNLGRSGGPRMTPIPTYQCVRAIHVLIHSYFPRIMLVLAMFGLLDAMLWSTVAM